MRRTKLICLSLLVSCAPNSKNTKVGEQRAGIKAKVRYQSREEILLDLKDKGKDQQDIETEKALLPKGGRVFVIKKPEHANSRELGFTTIDFMQVNVDGEFYYACNELEAEKQPQSFLGWVFSDPTYHIICNIEKPMDKSFDVMLQNYSKSPIGKYRFKIESDAKSLKQ